MQNVAFDVRRHIEQSICSQVIELNVFRFLFSNAQLSRSINGECLLLGIIANVSGVPCTAYVWSIHPEHPTLNVWNAVVWSHRLLPTHYVGRHYRKSANNTIIIIIQPLSGCIRLYYLSVNWFCLNFALQPFPRRECSALSLKLFYFDQIIKLKLFTRLLIHVVLITHLCVGTCTTTRRIQSDMRCNAHCTRTHAQNHKLMHVVSFSPSMRARQLRRGAHWRCWELRGIKYDLLVHFSH